METQNPSVRRPFSRADSPPPASGVVAASTVAKPNERLGILGGLFAAIVLVFVGGLLLTILGLGLFAFVKGTDVLYSAGYTARHWADAQAFPPSAEFCKGLFCRRTDTSPHHICGSHGRQSEHFVSFCPDHRRSNYLVFLDFSALGSVLWLAYGALVAIAAAIWASAVLWGGLLVACAPVLLAVGAPRRRALAGACGIAAATTGTLVGLAAGVAYAWW